MKIIDTVPFFLNNYIPSISFLRSYYEKYPEIFTEYFPRHCKDTEERHNQSMEKYPGSFREIQQVHENITPIIEEVVREYERLYDVTFPIQVNLIVGGYGSNAYTYQQIIPNITFALEKLSPDPNHLRVIVAHEFGHAAQNILTDRAGMDWTTAQWTHPFNWLYREGIATYLSERIVPNLKKSVYFTYNGEGAEWLNFAQQHIKEIKKAFIEDYRKMTGIELSRNWFSINGVNTFGYSRFGYFLGELFVQEEMEKHGELETIIAWENPHYLERVENWLLQVEGELV
ncbi:hypothetical protein [Psychrobacillus sp. MER TA 171]|uniref:hypothetical protein n=1 Tax=Psychrobacillus sp. MER TA 171 TaxID=2939577 RepID=UPI00203AECF9|nr:hypothetical protein [Psychrobacillus sp. MER TA 171]MCM3358753.1 hypothetical protein [Psychrobacillus sp. MER TA 171]